MPDDKNAQDATAPATLTGLQVVATFALGAIGLAFGYFGLPRLVQTGLIQIDVTVLQLCAAGSAYAGFLLAAWAIIVRPVPGGFMMIGMRRCDLSLLWIGAFAAALWTVVSSMLYSLAGVWEAALFYGANEVAPYRNDTAMLVGLFFLAGPLAALTEEILFRGILYAWLRQRLNVPIAALLSAALFTLAHPSIILAGLPAIIDTVFLAFLLALLFEARRSLWPGIFCHALHNTILLSLYLYQG